MKKESFMTISSWVYNKSIFLGTSDILEYLFKKKTFSTTQQNITEVQAQSKFDCKELSQ